MRKLVLFKAGAVVAGLAVSTLVAASPGVAQAEPAALAPLSTLERQRLAAHLQVTHAWVVDEVSTLTPAQLAFQPAADAWSIAHVLEHLVLVGQIYWDDLQTAVRRGPVDRASQMSDADVLWYGIDRTDREKAIPSELPREKPRPLRDALDAYRRNHQRLLQYIETTSDDLRRSFVDRQRCDAYQWALLIATHEQRHLLQVREIKAHPKFPRSR
jgi:uncharacterized damage-inducible protein DinB